jgi:hypothetical protein
MKISDQKRQNLLLKRRKRAKFFSSRSIEKSGDIQSKKSENKPWEGEEKVKNSPVAL